MSLQSVIGNEHNRFRRGFIANAFAASGKPSLKSQQVSADCLAGFPAPYGACRPKRRGGRGTRFIRPSLLVAEPCLVNARLRAWSLWPKSRSSDATVLLAMDTEKTWFQRLFPPSWPCLRYRWGHYGRKPQSSHALSMLAEGFPFVCAAISRCRPFGSSSGRDGTGNGEERTGFTLSTNTKAGRGEPTGEMGDGWEGISVGGCGDAGVAYRVARHG